VRIQRLLRLFPPAIWQFCRFGVVGVIGLGADITALTIVHHLGLGLLWGRVVSYLVAATTTWFFNRIWTFVCHEGSIIRQWIRFLLANLPGGGVNYAVYAGLILGLPFPFQTWPGLAVAAGSIAGMFVNFFLSRRFVFQKAERQDPP